MSTPAPCQHAACSKSFGSLPVARDIELSLPVGARYALIGPNGAGKTTLINLMTGMLAPNAGQIMLGDEDITALEPQDRVRRGLARTFQINTLFPGLNALEAVTLAVAERRGLAGQFWQNIGAHSETIDEAYEILRKLRLGDCCYQVTRELPYGRQRLLEIALALATKPKVLLLDEPAAGVPQEESGDIFEVVASLSDDLTLLFIEHDMHVVFRFATPHHRAGRRRDFRARLAGRNLPPIRACAKSIWASATMAEPLLKLDNVTRRLRRRAWCCTTFRWNCRRTAAWRCSAATASASRRCCSPSWATRNCAAARCCGAAAIYRACRRIGRAGNGIGWVAQEREIFPSLTVDENLTVAARPGPWDIEAVFKLFPRLAERRRNMGNQLSGGEQQMLATARALMTNPALLLLDEPFEGLAPVIVDELIAAMRTDAGRPQDRDRAGRAAYRDRAGTDHRRHRAGTRRGGAPRAVRRIAEGYAPRSNAWSGCASPRRREKVPRKEDTHAQSDDPQGTQRLFGDRRSSAAQAAGQGAASCSGPSSITRSGTSASRWRASCCRRRPACR